MADQRAYIILANAESRTMRRWNLTPIQVEAFEAILGRPLEEWLVGDDSVVKLTHEDETSAFDG